MKGLRVTKIAKEIKFEVRRKEMFLETTIRKIFENNSSFNMKYLISVFQQCFASIDRIFIFAGRLGIRLSFYLV